MLRNLFGFAVFAVLTIFALKVVLRPLRPGHRLAGYGALVGVSGLPHLPRAQACRSGDGRSGAGDDCGALDAWSWGLRLQTPSS